MRCGIVGKMKLSRKTVRLAVTLAEGAVEQRIAEVFDEEGF